MSDEILSLWTVYEKPKDYPQGYIARRFEVWVGTYQATIDTIKAETLEELRSKIPKGKVSIGRTAGDDPVIVEVWV